MQLLHEAESLLRAAGFRTARAPTMEDSIVFEDETVLGFVAVHAGIADMIAQWKAQQDAFLRTHAAGLRRDPSKAWNTYSVFLTAAPVDQAAWEMLGIESDVAATRKIIRGGLITRADVREALAPLLPLVAGHTTAESSVDALLAEKLGQDERALFNLVRERSTDDRQVVDWIIETSPPTQ
jgi:hypothetical protein